MLKRFRKILVVYLYCVFCTSLNARATLAFLDEWAKHLDYSKDNIQYIDLTWGAVAIESGFIHNLRFFGNYKIETGTNGRRIYAKDKSTEPLFEIIRELFPSTGGVLSVTVGGDFAKLCNELSCKDICLMIKNYLLSTRPQNIKNDILKATMYEDDLKKPRNKLLKNISTIIDNANKEGCTFLEKHTKEVLAQVLLAFLYEKINIQGDKLDDNTKIYKKETVKDLKDVLGEEMFTSEESKGATRKQSEAARTYFKELWENNPFPYIANPIQNGLAQAISKESKLLPKTFPDCVEVAIRHFFNIILYDPETRNFDLKDLSVVEAKKELFNNFYKNLQPNHELANNGSIELRTEWNKIMAHIPEVIYKIDDSGISIKEADFTPYNAETPKVGSNEIKAGVINLYNVLAYLLQKAPIVLEERNKYCDTIKNERESTITKLKQRFLDLFQENGESEESWEEESQYRFGITEIDISLTNVEYDSHDIYADITIRGEKIIKIGNKLYNFSIHILKGHANIMLEFANKKSIDESKYIFASDTYKIESSLNLLVTTINDKDGALFYWLYQEPINSLTSLLHFAYRLCNQTEIKFEESFITNLCNNIKSFLSEERNLLNLNDIDVGIGENNLLKTLCKNNWAQEELKKLNISNKIDVVTLSSNQNDIDLKIFGEWEKLNQIDITTSGTKTVKLSIQAKHQFPQNINLKNLERLASFDVNTINNIILNIENCSSLKNINYCFNSEADGISSLKIKDCPNINEIQTNVSRDNLAFVSLDEQYKNKIQTIKNEK